RARDAGRFELFALGWILEAGDGSDVRAVARQAECDGEADLAGGAGDEIAISHRRSCCPDVVEHRRIDAGIARPTRHDCDKRRIRELDVDHGTDDARGAVAPLDPRVGLELADREATEAGLPRGAGRLLTRLDRHE